MKTVLVVDDDPGVVQGLEAILEAEHFAVLTALTGQRGLQLACRENLDLIILDLRLPDMHGEELCRELRARGVRRPVLMLTTKRREKEKVEGFDAGADDYVTKPFSAKELIARVRALLRRQWEPTTELETYDFGEVTIDFRKLEAAKGKDPLKLSAREYAILKYFFLHEGEVVTRDMLLDAVWGYEQYPVTRTVDNFILSLRKKIEEDPGQPRHLLTVHTAGYKFVRCAG